MTRFLRYFLLVMVFSFAVDTIAQVSSDDIRQRAIRVGVMLPLHNINGDGKRMVEYYRGILMACDSLKQTGISVDIHAWNTAEDADILKILLYIPSRCRRFLTLWSETISDW